MNLYLTKDEVIDSLQTAIDFYRNFSEDIYPSFNIESWHVEVFLMHLPHIPASNVENFIPVVTKEFNNAVRQYSTAIVELIDPTKDGGKIILEKVSRKLFIKKRDQRKYNKQAPAPEPLFDRKLWMNYNNWILTKAFWEGFLMSQESGFEYQIPEDEYGPLDLFICEASKPLLGMNMMAREVHMPILDESLDNFIIYPFRSFGEFFYRGKKKKSRD